MPLYSFEKNISDYMSGVRNQLLIRPLYLGGITASGGGVGGPPGGFVGKLPQTQITYDLSMLATNILPVSGLSLLDNLNKIRYDIAQISVVASGLSDPGASGILIRDSINHTISRNIIPLSSKITIANGDGISGNPSIDINESNLTISNMQGVLGISHGGTNSVTASGAINNLLPSQTGNFNKILGTNGFVASWVTSSGGGGHTILYSGVAMPTETNLNFLGTGITVIDDPGNNATKITIVDGGGSSIDVLAVQIFS